MLSIPKNKYTLPPDHLTDEFFQSLESFCNQLYSAGMVNNEGIKITLGLQVHYNFPRIKHIIELYGYDPDMITDTDVSYLGNFLTQNFIYYYNKYTESQGINQETIKKYILTLDILLNVSNQTKHLFMLKSIVKNIMYTLGNAHLDKQKQLINQKIAPASVSQIIKTQNNILGIITINNRKHLYNLTRNKLLTAFDQTITKQSRVGDNVLIQLTSERMYTLDTLRNRAKHYIITCNNPTIEGFFSSLLIGNENKIKIMTEFFLNNFQKDGGKINDEEIINTIVDQENIFNAVTKDIFYFLDIFYTKSHWYIYNNNTLTLLGSQNDSIITKLRPITFHDKPGVQFLVRNREGYHIVISNFEMQEKFPIDDEDIKQWYKDPASSSREFLS